MTNKPCSNNGTPADLPPLQLVRNVLPRVVPTAEALRFANIMMKIENPALSDNLLAVPPRALREPRNAGDGEP